MSLHLWLGLPLGLPLGIVYFIFCTYIIFRLSVLFQPFYMSNQGNGVHNKGASHLGPTRRGRIKADERAHMLSFIIADKTQEITDPRGLSGNIIPWRHLKDIVLVLVPCLTWSAYNRVKWSASKSGALYVYSFRRTSLPVSTAGLTGPLYFTLAPLNLAVRQATNQKFPLKFYFLLHFPILENFYTFFSPLREKKNSSYSQKSK